MFESVMVLLSICGLLFFVGCLFWCCMMFVVVLVQWAFQIVARWGAR